ncbi:alpha-L-fucosidase [Flavicella sediminum]|uniref:alpha-L-fucosidase n=1 Tax=Flavicella sediminum TaxID=2585141 RepID=UPI001123500F|nr:alpha-L-fucosidase [Flavicella sediminum]
MKYSILPLIALVFFFQTGEAQILNTPSDQPDADGRIIKGRSDSTWWTQNMVNTDLSTYKHAPDSILESFKDLKFGLRIHWGIYSQVHGKESWVLKDRFNNKAEDLAWYHELYKGWYPNKFNADSIMHMAKDNGFQFFVFTAKHHDGFSMYDTKIKVQKRKAFTGAHAGEVEDCDLAYSIMETPFQRDVTKELVDAARKVDLKVGLYYSNSDWYDADFNFHDRNYTPFNRPKEFERFQNRHLGQIKELLTNYGAIDMLSLDVKAPKFAWNHMQKVARTAREIQPNVLLRWRGIGNYGDYQTPENKIPYLINKDLGTMPWQVIYSLSKRKNFAYEPDETYLRDGKWIIESLIDVVAKGGNFMLGIGPDISGAWHPKTLQAVKEAGDWLKVYGEAIYGTRPYKEYGQGPRYEFEKTMTKKESKAEAVYISDDFRFTQKGKFIYIFQYGYNPLKDEPIRLEALKGKKIKSIINLGTGEELSYVATRNFLNLIVPESTNKIASVYKVELF